MTSARYGAAARVRRRGFLADDFGRNGGLIVEPLRRRPVVLYMCIGLVDPPEWTTPAIVGIVLKTGLPDVERGTTGVVNRQPAFLTAADRQWQAASRLRNGQSA
jgi:hypothetical protein